MPARRLFAAAAAATLAQAAPMPWAAWISALAIVGFLALGFAAPAAWRGAAVRGAAVGCALSAVVRGLVAWRTGGLGAVSVGAAVPPAIVALAAVCLALLVGRWWRGIWRIAPEPAYRHTLVAAPRRAP